MSPTDPAAGVAALYPFLYADTGNDLRAVLDQVRASTVAKAAEITALRRVLAAKHGGALIDCAQAMAARFAAGGRLFVFGNGGSSTDAQQAATSFLNPREGRALPALSPACDIAAITALSDDVGFEVVFARQLAVLGRGPDIALALSTSGGSANLLLALEQAAGVGMLTVGLAGAPRWPDGRARRRRPPVPGPLDLGTPRPGGAMHDLPHPRRAGSARLERRQAGDVDMSWWAWLLIAIAAVLVVFGAAFGHAIGSDLFRYRRMHRM